MITGEELWQIAVWAEMQGGDKSYSHKINQKLDEVVRRHDI
jgi:phytoene/squalene synthetase